MRLTITFQPARVYFKPWLSATSMTSGRPISHEHLARTQRCLPGIFCQSLFVSARPGGSLSPPIPCFATRHSLSFISYRDLFQVTYHYCICTRFSNPPPKTRHGMTRWQNYYGLLSRPVPTVAAMLRVRLNVSKLERARTRKKAQILLCTTPFSRVPQTGKTLLLPRPF